MRALFNKKFFIFSALLACYAEKISGFQIPLKEILENSQDQDERGQAKQEIVQELLPESPGSRQERNGMLGFYFNPRDPISRLASSWWSKAMGGPQPDNRPSITFTKPDWFAFLKPGFFRPQQHNPTETCNGTCGSPPFTATNTQQQQPSAPIISFVHPMFLPGTSSAMVLMAQPAMSIPGGGMSVNMQMLPSGVAMLKPQEMPTSMLPQMPTPQPQLPNGRPGQPPQPLPNPGQHLMPNPAGQPSQPGPPYNPQNPYAPAHPHGQNTNFQVNPNPTVITNPNPNIQYPPPHFQNNNHGFPPNGKTYYPETRNSPEKSASNSGQNLSFDYKLPVPIVTPKGNITNLYLRIQPSLNIKPLGAEETSVANKEMNATFFDSTSPNLLLDNQILRHQLYNMANQTLQEFWTQKASPAGQHDTLIVLETDQREASNNTVDI